MRTSVGSLAVFMFALSSPAQQLCRVRYQYNASGDRIQRDWYCSIPGDEVPEEDEHRTDGKRRAGLEAVHMAVAPNPAADKFQVTFSQTEVDGLLEMISMTGAVVLSRSVRSSMTSLDVSDIPAGVYHLRFTSGTESIISSCIVQH